MRGIGWVLVLLSAAFAACGPAYPLWSDIDLSDYDRPPAFKALNPAKIHPVDSVVYWEYRSVSHDATRDVTAPTEADCQRLQYQAATATTAARCRVPAERRKIWFASGTLCKQAADVTACKRTFESLEAGSGFNEYYCFSHGPCFSYLAVDGGAEPYTIGNPAGVAKFLGPIDTPEEALLLASVNGYGWDTSDKSNGAIRLVSNGYELILVRHVDNCPPTTRRYLMRVSTEGVLTMLRSQIAEKEEGSCVVI